jgi:AAA domain
MVRKALGMSINSFSAYTPPPTSPFKLLDDVEVEHLVPPAWVIPDLLPADSLTVMFGCPGDGKTFVALDMAFSVATGNRCCGRAVKQGNVIYVVAEGAPGLGDRVRAWKQVHGITGLAGVYFLPEALQVLYEGEVTKFIDTARRLQPVLVVIDTLARCMVGGNEDGAQDMGRFVAGADDIRQEFRCANLIVHHPGKSNHGTERGSGALRAAVSTMIRVTKKDELIVLSCEKEKDAEPFAPVSLRLDVVGLENGRSSCVIEYVDQAGPGTRQPAKPVLSITDREAIAALSLQPDGTARLKDWRAAAGAKDRTFQRTADRLIEIGMVTKNRGIYRILSNPAATAIQPPTTDHGSSTITTAATDTPPLRGVVEAGGALLKRVRASMSTKSFAAED